MFWTIPKLGDETKKKQKTKKNRIERCNSRFFTISPLCCELSPTHNYAPVARVQLCANHVQHIERLSCATCCVTCHMVRRDSSAIKFDRVEIAFILALLYRLLGFSDSQLEEFVGWLLNIPATC